MSGGGPGGGGAPEGGGPALAPRLARVAPSPTLAVSRLARELREAGRDVVSLAAGEPDFDTPAHVRAAAAAAAERGETRYTDVGGTAGLKDAVRAKLLRDAGLELGREEVIVSCGAKQSLFNALLATLAPGDEVVFPAPHWVSYPDMARIAEGEPRAVATSPESGFRPDAESIERAMTPRTRWVLLNSPCNPTGAVIPRSEMEEIARMLRAWPRAGAISDEIYADVAYGETRPASFAAAARDAAPEVAARVLTVDGVSKAHAMTGWRIGWAAGDAALVAAMAKIQSQSTSNPCSVSQAAARAALEGPQDHLAERREAFRRRRDLAAAALDAVEGLECRAPEGAFYAWASCAGLMGRRAPSGRRVETDADLAAFLLEEAGVAVVPGVAFGLSPFLRVSFAASEETLARALERVAAAAARLD